MKRQFQTILHALLLLGGVVFLAAGVVILWWVVGRAEREMRNDLLMQARLIEHAVDIELVKALSGDESDLERPEYTRIREQFSSVRRADGKYRFVYLMGQKEDGTIFFFVDAGEDSPALPGTEYDEASPELVAMFDNAQPLVEGPLPDEWGVWVSALVPMQDPVSGEVIAVLGVDVDARVWRWDVAVQAALPAGLFLALLAISAAALLHMRRAASSPKPVLHHLMLPLGAVLCILIGGFAAIMVIQQRDELNQSSRTSLRIVSGEFARAVTQQAAAISAVEDMLIHDHALRQMLKFGDRDGLLESYAEMYKKLHEKHGIDRLYFIDANRDILRRIHNPTQYGERLSRHTILEAERTGKVASGLEVGKQGSLSLRVVSPVFDEGALVGYIEMSRNITSILANMNKQAGVELALFVQKEVLDRETWTTRQLSTGEEADWDRLPEHVLFYSTISPLPPELAPFAGMEVTTYGDTPVEANFGGADWRIMSSPVNDATGAEIGHILVLCDISAIRAAHQHMMFLVAFTAPLLLSGLLGLLYILLRRTDEGIILQQTELHETTRLLKSLIDNSPALIWMKDAKGRYLLVNQVFEDMFGLSNEQVAGKYDSQIFPPQTAQVMQQGFNEVFRTEQLLRTDIEISHEGHAHTMLSLIFPTRNNAGVLNGVCCVATDITERKNLELQLKELNENLEQKVQERTSELYELNNALRYKEQDLQITLDSITEAVIVTDEHGLITRLNPAARKMTGWWDQAPALARHFSEVIDLRELQSDAVASNPLQQVIQCGQVQPAHGQVRLLCRRGGECLVSASAAPLLEPGGSIRGMVLVMRDVTEEVRLSEQLMHSQKMDAIGQLAGGVAHDFNNMLGGIMGLADIMLNNLADNPELHEFCQQIITVCQRAAGLTRQLLSFSRKGKIYSEYLNLHQTIASVVQLLERSIDKRIELECHLEASMHTVYGDASQLHSALLNLGINARDALPQGGKIVYSTRNVVFEADSPSLSRLQIDPGEYILISVSDNGCGMEEGVAERIFEPFFTTKGLGKGTGLGLAAVYGTVMAHHGGIDFDTVSGGGTTFRLYLPYREADMSCEVPESYHIPHSGESRGNVLVIDDETIICRVFRYYLKRAGYDAVCIDNARRALEIYERESANFSLVILDMVMPEMDGLSCLREIRRITPERKVVICSGYAPENSHSFFNDYTGVAFIHKPFKYEELCRVIGHLLEGGQ